jgi:cytosine/creatinine deaminase
VSPTAPLVDCHLHLGASPIAGRPRFNRAWHPDRAHPVLGRAEATADRAGRLRTASEIVRWSAAQGTLFIRAHADASGDDEAMVRGLLRVRDEVADLCTIQVTAFPQDGIFAREGDEERLENAIRLGVDCIGGIPHYEPVAELGLREVQRVFERKGLRPQGHRPLRRDRRPASRFLEVMADDTVKYGLNGRVTASHCTAMGSYEPYYSFKLGASCADPGSTSS